MLSKNGKIIAIDIIESALHDTKEFAGFNGKSFNKFVLDITNHVSVKILLKSSVNLKICIMKKNNMITLAVLALTISMLPHSIRAQDDKEKQEILSQSVDTKNAFIKKDSSMSNLFSTSYGYAIFPKITKAGLVFGGSGGYGAVYEQGKSIGTTKATQVTVGAQIGAQAYSEVIFFENKDVLGRFKANKVEFSADLSAVAAKSGVSKNAKYINGVAIFISDLGGLMAEASVGGQKFTYKPL